MHKGQAATEYLLTYGWAFLLVVAVIAGITQLDILGNEPVIEECQTGDPTLTCDKTRTKASEEILQINIQNAGRQGVSISNAIVTNVNGQNTSAPCQLDKTVLERGTDGNIICTGLDLQADQASDVEVTYQRFPSSQGDQFQQTRRTQVRAQPGSSFSSNLDAPADTDQVLSEMAGQGTPQNPYAITTIQELQAMEADLDANYILGQNIDASTTQSWNSGAGFKPIGTNSNPFTGSLDGNGNTISNLFVNHSIPRTGLFGFINGNQGTGNNTFTDLALNNVVITGSSKIGGLAGDLRYADVNDVSITGTLYKNGSGGSNIGGLAGNTRTVTIRDVSTHVDVDIINPTGWGLSGALIGHANYGTKVHDTTTAGTVTVTNGTSISGAGGIAAYLAPGGLINKTSSSADTSAEGKDGRSGGLLAEADNVRVIDSHATGSGYGTSEFSMVGGLVGWGRGGMEINRSYATGSVEGHAPNSFYAAAGSLVGYGTEGITVQDSYATGSVNWSGQGVPIVGSLIGYIREANIENSYTTSSVENGSYSGAITGYSYGPTRLDGVYWNNETANHASADGGNDGNIDTINVTGLTTSEMQNTAATTNMPTLDFTDTWQTTSGYPDLQ